MVSEGSNTGSYSVALKEKDTLSRTNLLKGVLVLTTFYDNQTSTEALEVNLPIYNNKAW